MRPAGAVDEPLPLAAPRLHDGLVSVNGGTLDPASPASSRPADRFAEPPPAVRARRPGWRDPRLWVGVAIVAASVVAGARVVGAADDSVSVWAVAGDVGAGELLTAEDLVAERVRFADPDQLALYLPVSDALPADARLSRGLGAGELVPRSALASAADLDGVQLPIAVEPGRVPPSVAPGSVVDVYLTPGEADRGSAGAGGLDAGRPVLAAVTVLEVPPLDDGFAAAGTRQLVLDVPEEDAARYFRAVGGLTAPVLTVVRRG